MSLHSRIARIEAGIKPKPEAPKHDLNKLLPEEFDRLLNLGGRLQMISVQRAEAGNPDLRKEAEAEAIIELAVLLQKAEIH